jgi:predicted NBD/HSP70 family sugar kinase
MSYIGPRHKFETVRGVQQFGVRLANERAVLSLVALNPGMSSAELARESGLGPQTVSRILSDLEHGGFVRRGDVRRGMRGQPATPFFLEARSAFCIGCEIGWRSCTVEMVDMFGQVLGKHRWDYAFPDARTIFTEVGSVARLLTAILPDSERHRLLGIGVASPSSIARNIDLMGGSPADAAAWRDIDVAEQIEAATGLPASIHNDGNVACWGELGVMPMPRPASFAYFLIGTFIAAGIVAESTLWEGPTGNSANLGSMIITDRHGQHNFVHLIASIMALETKLFAAGVPVPPGNPVDWDWATLEPHASEWIDEAGEALAKAVVNTAAVIEFNLAVIDGVMPRPIVERMVESVRFHGRELPALTADRPTIVTGHLGAEAPARGAAMLPMFRRFFARDWEHFTK